MSVMFHLLVPGRDRIRSAESQENAALSQYCPCCLCLDTQQCYTVLPGSTCVSASCSSLPVEVSHSVDGTKAGVGVESSTCGSCTVRAGVGVQCVLG